MINEFNEPIRQDTNKNGGGILLHISEDIPTKALSFETLPIEGFYVEINLHNKKWLLSCSYNTEKGNIKNHLQALCTSFHICDLLREKGPTAIKRRFKMQLTMFSL